MGERVLMSGNHSPHSPARAAQLKQISDCSAFQRLGNFCSPGEIRLVQGKALSSSYDYANSIQHLSFC